MIRMTMNGLTIQEVVIDKHTIWKSGIIYHVNQGKIQIPADFSLKLDYIFIV